MASVRNQTKPPTEVKAPATTETPALVTTPETDCSSEVDTELTYEEFTDQWKLYCQEESGAFQDLDKTVLTLSTAVLSISIAFVAQMLKSAPVMAWLLYGAWTCFIVSMCCTLVSMMSSIYAIRRTRNILKAVYDRVPDARKQSNRWAEVTEILTGSAAGALVCGMLALALFATFNVRALTPRQETKMSTKSNDKPTAPRPQPGDGYKGRVPAPIVPPRRPEPTAPKSGDGKR